MRVLLFLSLLLFSASAFADPPLPPKKKEALEALKEKVATEQRRKDELDQQAALLQKDLATLKKDLISTAGEIQLSEKKLQKLETERADLKKKQSELLDSLQSDRKSLSALIIALERIRRLPPETLIAKPGAPRETAQAATALSAILPELNRRAESLRDKLESLSVLEKDLEQSRAELEIVSSRLKREKANMDILLAARSKSYSQAQIDIKEQQKAVAMASKEASDFQDLIVKLEEKNRQLRERQLKQKKKKKNHSKKEQDLADSVPLPGAAQLPVSGVIRVRYGQENEIGASSQGIRIEARSGAIVVAPMGGVVRYAGPFKSYGNIVLLEHKNNYYSLIAGLNRIDTVVGQSAGSGEPIGNLGTQDKPVLYYELRLNGQPIDPARKFSDLGT
jgi:septal ring factor EnvC (AmiA/AmiB activator)